LSKAFTDQNEKDFSAVLFNYNKIYALDTLSSTVLYKVKQALKGEDDHGSSSAGAGAGAGAANTDSDKIAGGLA
jgi:hypothetical protein